MSIFDHIKGDGKPLTGPAPEEIKNAKSGDTIRGHIININKKGFGFISSEAIPFERIFFHWQGLKRDTLRFPQLMELFFENKKGNKPNIQVEFECEETEPNNWRAIKVKVVEEE